jgi:uncharacterized membrane protein YhaH (DUF805 family)
MSIRQLIERPFRHYADFSGRSGRAEYWLLILLFVVVTEIAWLVGFGGMRLAGYEATDHSTQLHFDYETSRNGDAQTHLQDLLVEGEDSHITFKLHRHESEGLHFHGHIRRWHKRWDRGAASDGHHGADGHNRTVLRFGHHHDDVTEAEDGAEILEIIVALAMLVPILATGARRLHDSGKSGWWQLFVLIPIAGWLVLVIFFLLPGEPNENRFGPPPA